MSPTPNFTRRQWLAALSTTAASRLMGATKPRSFGVQLYTVRGILGKDPDRVLKTIAEIGYREVEGYSRSQTLSLITKIKQYGLTPRSCHVETPLITADW